MRSQIAVNKARNHRKTNQRKWNNCLFNNAIKTQKTKITLKKNAPKNYAHAYYICRRWYNGFQYIPKQWIVLKRALFSQSNSENHLIFTSELGQLGKKWRPSLHPRQVKKSSKLTLCGVYYLTVLVYTKTTIHLSVGGEQWIFTHVD